MSSDNNDEVDIEKSVGPYTNLFVLRNRDPRNDVLYKEFYLYSILMIYVFFFWYIVSVLDNYEYLVRTEKGTAIYYLTGFVAGCTLIAIALYYIQNKYPSSLFGIVFVLLLISMGICLFTFDVKQIDPRFEQDPSSLAISFLLAYSFVSYFIVR